ERNSTMSMEIISETRSASGDLPIAFIGNFHTSGILSQLETAGIGYVVVEPRLKAPPSEAEDNAFGQANHPDSRKDYLQSVRLNMGFNGPTAPEVREFFAPRIDAKVP